VHGNVLFHTARGHAALRGVHDAPHAAVAVSEGGGDRPAAPSSYLAPKRPRRAYGDKASTMGVRPSQPEPVVPAAVSALISAMLRSHALDWASTQKDNCRTYLLSPTGRFQKWCATTGVITKYRIHLRALARFQAQTPGYGDGLADIHRIPAPRMPTERLVLALSRQEEEQVLAACTTTRDRLIVELLLATGVRVSELAALTLTNLLLTARPPRLLVVGSVHDPDCTKSRRPRQVPFRSAYASLPHLLSDWIVTERDPSGLCRRQEVFLGKPPGPAGRAASPLNIWGFESLCKRVSLRAGVHFSPHVLRHTWATRMVDAGVQPIHMMEVGGGAASRWCGATTRPRPTWCSPRSRRPEPSRCRGRVGRSEKVRQDALTPLEGEEDLVRRPAQHALPGDHLVRRGAADSHLASEIVRGPQPQRHLPEKPRAMEPTGCRIPQFIAMGLHFMSWVDE
jgi:integrase